MKLVVLFLEWAASLLGLFGSMLLSLNLSYSYTAWYIYIVSNSCLIAFSFLEKRWGLLLMSTGFLVSAILGCVNYTK